MSIKELTLNEHREVEENKIQITKIECRLMEAKWEEVDISCQLYSYILFCYTEGIIFIAKYCV